MEVINMIYYLFCNSMSEIGRLYFKLLLTYSNVYCMNFQYCNCIMTRGGIYGEI